MIVPQLAFKSLWNRRGTAALTVFAIAVSITLLLGVQKLRYAARASFASTISQTDLIVGARSSPINLLLYSVFRLGDATANVTWKTYERISRQRDVAWTIPISLGDSHHGFRVLGTTAAYFEHYQYAQTHRLEFSTGHAFDDLYDAVLGADVAQQLGYHTGDAIVIAHGLGTTSFAQHKDKPFRVAGILKRTGTPVDRTVHISLEAITAIHIDWQSGMQAPVGARISANEARHRDLTPDSITAFFVGLKSKVNTFQLQRGLNEYPEEPLLAIIPGVALQQLWSLVGIADTALLIVSGFVVFAGLLGMLIAILTSLNERRREMAILRSVGARPAQVFALLVAEAGSLALGGVTLGVAMTYALLFAARPILENRFGLYVPITGLDAIDLLLLGGVIAAGLLMGLLPAWRAYRNTLSDGLTIRV